MKRWALTAVLVLTPLAVPASALAGHGLEKLLDHPAPALNPGAAPPMSAQSGGPGARWEFVATIPTGNPHTDLDFFTRRGNMYASVGTLAAGPNGGGQTIVQLTDGSRVAPKFLSSAPTASCLSNPNAALALQHDAEAAPKGGAILNTDVLAADRRDAQVVVDATDAEGRCHDQGVSGLALAPQGGLEIIDVTDPANPETIGLTAHIGEAHTVNIDPKRPHIAYAATSDNVNVNAAGKRNNENMTDAEGLPNAERLDLDGFEVVNMASCMNFPAGTSLAAKRARCRPEVYRYRYPNTGIAQGHTNKTGANGVFGCHELEVYPDDRLMCASGNAMIAFDMRGAFDDRGTPRNFSDDRPRGSRLQCRERAATGLLATAAQVTDCVTSATDPDFNTVPKWLQRGAPSLAGVGWLGSAYHQGRESATGAAAPKFNSDQDIDFDHESELSNSGRYILSTDERGGGVAPPGASCSPTTDVKAGNGGIHAYDVNKLLRRRPNSAADAQSSYARATGGGRAIYRAPIRTRPQESLCTAHVFQQIPGQNRIFMGWYSQGTQVVDFEERADGSLRFKEAGYFIPQNSNEWVSHVFKVQEELNGTFTYWGATGDFNVGTGRNAIDVWKVNLPPAPLPRGRLAGTGPGFASRCLARKVRVGRKGIGRVKLGLTKRRLLRRARPVRRSKRVWRWCVKRDGRGRVSAVFDRRGRVRLVGSTARRHRLRSLARGTRVRTRTLRRLGARRINRRLYRRGRVVFGVRRRRVTFVAVVDKRVLRKRKTLGGYLRRARLR